MKIPELRVNMLFHTDSDDMGTSYGCIGHDSMTLISPLPRPPIIWECLPDERLIRRISPQCASYAVSFPAMLTPGTQGMCTHF